MDAKNISTSMMDAKNVYELEFRRWLGRIGEAFSSFPWEDPNAYSHWLAQTYFYVRHTTTMICMSASFYGPKEEHNFEQALRHLAEERGHDRLLINDLDHLDMSINDFEERIETSLFYQNQYYMIQNEGPASHLGYALLLEAMCAQYGPEVYRRVCKAHGPKAGTFLDVHVVADQSHAEHGFQELVSLPSTDAQAVLKNVRQSAFLYERLLQNAASEARLRQPEAYVA